MALMVRLRAAVGLAAAQLRHHRVRTALAVAAVALAVLSTTLLASVGVGVLETGTERLDAADRDLWMTGGAVRLAPGTVGGIENRIQGSHRLAAELDAREEVRAAVPIAFQIVYVGSTPTDLQTIVGVGVTGGGPALQLTEGPGFEGGDVHYANGTYDGPMTREVVIDERTAALFDVGVGDTLYVGGTVANARRNAYTVVGISPTFSRFVGTATVAVPLSELQTLTGTTRTDPASVITITLVEGADVEAVRAELERDYPGYAFRTNAEQLRTMFRERAVLLASAVTLVGLAVVTGVVLTANALALLAFQQRAALGALKAGGVSAGTLVAVVGAQGVLLGAAGGLVGVALTPPLGLALSVLAERVVGFGGLVRTPAWVYVAGFGIAVVMGTVASAVAGWRVARLSPLRALRE